MRNLSSYGLSFFILIAVVSIVFSLVRISLAEKKLSEQVLQLNSENERYSGIEEEIFHLDELLTNSVYMYVYTKSDHWREEYENQRKRLGDLLSNQLRFTSDDSIRASLKHLKIAEIHLVGLENEAMRLLHRDDSSALAVLNSDTYWHHKEDYADGLYHVTEYLESVKEENKLGIAEGLKQNQLMYFLILFLNVATWSMLLLLFNKSRKSAQRQNQELNKVNNTLNESLELERIGSKTGDEDAVINKYLNFLEHHLPFGAHFSSASG